MNVLDIIEAKKRGRELDETQINDLIAGFTAREVPEYQMAAFLMAVWFRGMTPAETAALTSSTPRCFRVRLPTSIPPAASETR
jgi:thymidine phosphorylase